MAGGFFGIEPDRGRALYGRLGKLLQLGFDPDPLELEARRGLSLQRRVVIPDLLELAGRQTAQSLALHLCATADLIGLGLCAGHEALAGLGSGVGNQRGLVRSVRHELCRLFLRLVESRLSRTLGAQCVLVNAGRVGEKPPCLVMSGVGVGAQCGNLCLDLGTKLIREGLRSGQQPECCRAGLLGGPVQVA